MIEMYIVHRIDALKAQKHDPTWQSLWLAVARHGRIPQSLLAFLTLNTLQQAQECKNPILYILDCVCCV